MAVDDTPDPNLNSIGGPSKAEGLSNSDGSSSSNSPHDHVFDLARTLSTYSFGISSKGEYSPWPTYWPMTVVGLAYLLHLRYRRKVPRIIPRITPLRPFELYATAGLTASVIVEQQHFYANLKLDRDLLVLEFFSAHCKDLWLKHRAKYEKQKRMQIMNRAIYFYPRNGGLSEKVRWFHDHWWASHVAWNFTTIVLHPLDCRDVSEHDLDVSITYIANGLEQDGTILSVGRTVPFALAFLGLTPLGLWARYVGRRTLTHSVHALQRTLFYLAAYVSLGYHHHRCVYPSELHDKHSVAEMLCRKYRGLGPSLDLLRQSFKWREDPKDIDRAKPS